MKLELVWHRMTLSHPSPLYQKQILITNEFFQNSNCLINEEKEKKLK